MDGRPTARFRPFVVVEDLDDAVPTRGRFRLPAHIRWCGPEIDYHLEDRGDLVRVYEQVLSEGNETDIRKYVNASMLMTVWDDVVLPAHMKAAWDSWVEARRTRRVS